MFLECCKNSYCAWRLALNNVFYLQSQKENDALDLEEELRENFQQLENEKAKTGRKNSFMKSKKVRMILSSMML